MKCRVGQIWRDVYNRGDYLIKEVGIFDVTVEWVWLNPKAEELDTCFPLSAMENDTFLYDATELILELL